MAQVTINIPDAHIATVLDAFAYTYGWQPGDPLTKAQHAKRRVAEHIKAITQAYIVEKARQDAENTAQTQVGGMGIS